MNAFSQGGRETAIGENYLDGGSPSVYKGGGVRKDIIHVFPVVLERRTWPREKRENGNLGGRTTDGVDCALNFQPLNVGGMEQTLQGRGVGGKKNKIRGRDPIPTLDHSLLNPR